MGLLKDTDTKKPKIIYTEEGKYRCVFSASPGYRLTKHYTFFRNENGNLCVTGEDGFTDEANKLHSSFIKVPDDSFEMGVVR